MPDSVLWLEDGARKVHTQIIRCIEVKNTEEAGFLVGRS
jgi:hypothetical protein